MKKNSILSGLAWAAMFTMSLYSCSSENELPEVNVPEADGSQLVVRALNLQGTFNGYEGQRSNTADTRADGSTWKEGDKIYLRFTVGSDVVTGTAVYTSTGWTVSYYGTLSEGSNIGCTAAYFENAEEGANNTVNLTEKSAIYQDLSAEYSNNNDTLTIVANLSPKLGRVRFTGNENDRIWLYGLKTYSGYNNETNKFVTTTGKNFEQVDSTGTTEYIYASFSTDTIKSIGLLTSEDAFTRTFTSDILAAGNSGYMAIPSVESHNQWQSGLVFTVNGVQFKMIAVPGYSGGRYCIAETETTGALYYNVTNSSTVYISQLPMSSLTYSSAESFTTTLTQMLGVTFRMPTADEWMFAAKGGNRSKGYAYAGSNNIDEVAWYSGNTSSKQKVKQKMPNELGIYDMSGNVDELVNYKTSGGYYYYYGGSYNYNSSYCGYTSYHDNIYYGSTQPYIGFRFVMPY
jgi:hypothetical protein